MNFLKGNCLLVRPHDNVAAEDATLKRPPTIGAVLRKVDDEDVGFHNVPFSIMGHVAIIDANVYSTSVLVDAFSIANDKNGRTDERADLALDAHLSNLVPADRDHLVLVSRREVECAFEPVFSVFCGTHPKLNGAAFMVASDTMTFDQLQGAGGMGDLIATASYLSERGRHHQRGCQNSNATEHIHIVFPQSGTQRCLSMVGTTSQII